MSEPLATCEFCGAPSTLLCDGRIHRVGETEYRVPYGQHYGHNTRSCDATVCRACARKVSDVHINATRNGRRACRWDTVDLCPRCQSAQEQPVPVEAST